MHIFEHVKAAQRLLRALPEGESKLKVSKCQTKLVLIKVDKVRGGTELTKVMEAGFEHFAREDAQALMEAMAEKVQSLMQVESDTTRQEWEFCNMLPGVVIGNLPADNGHTLLMEFLANAGIWNPSEPTCQLMSALLCLATNQEGLTDSKKRPFENC